MMDSITDWMKCLIKIESCLGRLKESLAIKDIKKERIPGPGPAQVTRE
jgi:hypothetical protein